MQTKVWKILLSCVLAVAAMVVAQLIAILAGELLGKLSAVLGYAFAGAAYPVLCWLLLKIISEKLLGTPLADARVAKPRLKPVWCVSAVVMPALVIGVYLLFPGEVSFSADKENLAGIIAADICLYSIGGGIAEEMVFRGAIMSALERRFGRVAAAVAPSVLFGLMHIIGNDLNFLSIVQLIIAGTAVGVLFSVVACESGSIWNSAVMHICWNASTFLFHIGDAADENAVWSYALESLSFAVTGGDFGMEASVISICAYLIFTAVGGVLLLRKKPALELTLQKKH